jgi:hemolysin activation/secretion protein
MGWMPAIPYYQLSYGTLSLAYANTSSAIIEEPFNALDINGDSRYYELTLRQPLSQTPTQEFALGSECCAF